MQVKPIGVIHSPIGEALGTPIHLRAAEGVEGQKLELEKQFEVQVVIGTHPY